ncbi:hypothetical protein CF319_g1775 [Tilletia indica]|nr:hypothetical protein CF319_g1775 [Tilletia indica]
MSGPGRALKRGEPSSADGFSVDRVKRAKIDGGSKSAGGSSVGRSASSSSSTSARTGLIDLPVELLHKIFILSGNPSMLAINRHFHAVIKQAPTNVKAAYIIAKMWLQIGLFLAPPSRVKNDTPLYDPDYRKLVDQCCSKSDPLPPRMIDPREWVRRASSNRSSSQDGHNVFGIGDRALEILPALSDPLGFALKFPICTSSVIDAFSRMLHDIPQFSGIAERVSINGRMRVKSLPAGLVARLKPRTSSTRRRGALPNQRRQGSQPSLSSLHELVSQLGQGPNPPEESLRTFLRVLFWHLSSHVEMSPARATATATASASAMANPSSPPPLLKMQKDPCLEMTEDSDSWSDDGALLQSASTRNLWALRLIRRFERKPLRCLVGDQLSPDAAFGSGPLHMTDEDPDMVVTYLVSTGWVEGLRFAVQAETPDEVVLESGICNQIARVLMEEVIDQNDPLLVKHRGQLLQHSSSSEQIQVSAPAPAPSQPSATPPSILFARGARPVGPLLLTVAVREGQFDIVDYLMKEHGLTPNLSTLRALERVRRRAPGRGGVGERH